MAPAFFDDDSERQNAQNTQTAHCKKSGPPTQTVDQKRDQRYAQQGAARPTELEKTDGQTPAMKRDAFADVSLQGRVKNAFSQAG